MTFVKKWKRGKVRVTALIMMGLAACLFSGCSTSSSPAEATTQSEEEKTRELFSVGLDDDGRLKDLKPEDYINKLADYQNLKIPLDKVKVRKEDVDEQIRAIMMDYSETKEVTKRKIKKGDLVRLSYEVEVDGKALPEESVTDLEIEVGSGVFEDLEEGIQGKKPGKKVSIDFTLPDPYENDESLSGKDAVIKADISCILVNKQPDLDDDFVKDHLSSRYGVNTVKELRKALRARMRKEKRGNYAMQEILQKSDMKEVPESLVESCIDRYLAQARKQAELNSMTFREFLRQGHYANEEAFREAARDACSQEAALYILIDAIADREEIKAGKEDLELLANGELTVDRLQEYYPDAYLYRQVLNLKVRDKIVEYIKLQ